MSDVEIVKTTAPGEDDLVIRKVTDGGRIYRVRMAHPEDLSPRLIPRVTQGQSNIVPDKCLGCAEVVWHSEGYHFKQLTLPESPKRTGKLRLVNARNRTEVGEGEIIETLDVRIVAVRAGDGTWAAYWKPLGPSHEGSYAIQGTLGPDPESIASGGHKLNADAARFSFFTQIVGDYRK